MVGPSHDWYSARWQLSRGAVAGLAVLAILLISIATALFLLPVFHPMHDDEEEEPDSTIVAINAIVQLSTMLGSALGVFCYIYVASTAPRPGILHVYGLVLVLGLVQAPGRGVSDALDRSDTFIPYTLVHPTMYLLWASTRAIFCKAVTDKLMVLGPPRSRCQSVSLWGKLFMGAILTAALSGGISWLVALSLALRGVSVDDIYEATTPSPFPAEGSGVSAADKVVFSIMLNISTLALLAFFLSAAVYIVMARRQILSVRAALEVRGTPGDQLTNVRRTLRHHLLGIVLSLASTMMLLVLAAGDSMNLLGQEDLETLLSSTGNLIEFGGDVAGILFLSGIGTLMRHEDPEAGDINHHIRSLLRAAVLNGRADFAFEGEVVATPSNRCVVSFPGKFLDEWKSLTWVCERHELSTACVFLPQSDPLHRFGAHSPCPETPGSCWCVSLYGEEKPWGCRWFQEWEANVQKAVELELELVVVFFPGQADKGLVDWEALGAVDLWNGVGLGGSQKGEAAYLRHKGIEFTSVDLDGIRSSLASSKMLPQAVKTPAISPSAS